MTNTLSIATDYISDKGNPYNSLIKIADAGFTHIHWGHQITSDYIFTDEEIEYIGKMIKNAGLKTNDLHGSPGKERCWYSSDEYTRIAGRELIRNRIKMTACLGGEAVVLHPFEDDNNKILEIKREQGAKTFSELKDYALSMGVKIALENLYTSENNFDTIDYYFNCFSSDFIGFCWDTGHTNIPPHNGKDRCRNFIERLEVIHLADNKGITDDHQPVYSGTVDWDEAINWIIESPYRKPLTIEVEDRGIYKTEEELLNVSHDTGIKFRELLLTKYN